MTDRGPWIQTYTGRKFHVLDPRPGDFVIEDIAHALALTNRFNGHLPEPYSVAQHSLLVSMEGPQEFAFVGLMHDATEAYVGDMTAPLKSALPEYREIERQIWVALAAQFGLPLELPEEVKQADLRALVTEARAFMPKRLDDWDLALGVEPFDFEHFTALPWKLVEGYFLDHFHRLQAGGKRPWLT